MGCVISEKASLLSNPLLSLQHLPLYSLTLRDSTMVRFE